MMLLTCQIQVTVVVSMSNWGLGYDDYVKLRLLLLL